MKDDRTEFEKSLDPSFKPGPSGIVEKPEVTTETMEQGMALNHDAPITIMFPHRYQAMECWSAVKKILEAFNVDQGAQHRLMGAMSTLATALDESVEAELKEREKNLGGGHESGHVID